MYLKEDIFSKKASRDFCRMVMTHNPAIFRFPSLKNQSEKVPRHKVLAVGGISSYHKKTSTSTTIESPTNKTLIPNDRFLDDVQKSPLRTYESDFVFLLFTIFV